jgi:hypothetical protein
MVLLALELVVTGNYTDSSALLMPLKFRAMEHKEGLGSDFQKVFNWCVRFLGS